MHIVVQMDGKRKLLKGDTERGGEDDKVTIFGISR